MNPTHGAVLATLVTAFGNSHVVGGAYHAGRGTLFLLRGKVPGAPNGNRIAEINPVTGAVLNTFVVGGFMSVNYGKEKVSGRKRCQDSFLAIGDNQCVGETHEGS